jgi:hypothetical protein
MRICYYGKNTGNNAAEACMRFLRFAHIGLIIIVVICLLSGCSGPAQLSFKETATTMSYTVPDNYVNYPETAGDYSISYPRDWGYNADAGALNTVAASVTGTDSSSASLIFIAGLPQSGGYYPSVNIVTEPAPTGIKSLNDAVKSGLEGLLVNDPNFTVISRYRIDIGERQAVFLEMTGHFSSADTLTHCDILFALRDNVIWVVTAGCDDSDFAKYSTEFKTILANFRINS